MNKAVGVSLLIVGIALLIIGYNAASSFTSDVSRAFANSPGDQAIWYLVGGGVLAAVGFHFAMNRR